MIRWVNNHPNWSWLIGIITVPLIIYGLGYSIAFLLAGPYPEMSKRIIDGTSILMFVTPVLITIWAIKTRNKNRKRDN